MWKVLRTLKEDKYIMILPADKGRASVALDKVTYHHADRKGLSQKLTEELLNVTRGEYLAESVYNKIRPKRMQPLRIYGLLKIHKVNTYLRHNLSCEHFCFWSVFLASRCIISLDREIGIHS